MRLQYARRVASAAQGIDVASDRTKELEMIRRSGRRTVTQMFIDVQNTGTHDDLVILEAESELDRLLASIDTAVHRSTRH
jgi:glutaredoxin